MEQRSVDRDLTVVVRSGRRHVFQYCRELNLTWSVLVGALVNLLAGPRAHDWGLLVSTGPSCYMLATPDENVLTTIRRCHQSVFRCGMIEIFLVLRDSNGSFPDAPDCEVSMTFVPSDIPVQLPKGLVDFIDHLRPASQVS